VKVRERKETSARWEIRSCGYEHVGVNEKDGFHDRQLKDEERGETSESYD